MSEDHEEAVITSHYQGGNPQKEKKTQKRRSQPKSGVQFLMKEVCSQVS